MRVGTVAAAAPDGLPDGRTRDTQVIIMSPDPEVAELHREGRHGLVEEFFRTLMVVMDVAGCRAREQLTLKHQHQLCSGQVSGEP